MAALTADLGIKQEISQTKKNGKNRTPAPQYKKVNTIITCRQTIKVIATIVISP